ncbi:M48 family metallopeptidase [Flammeovirgaceae bacterium SG7u.111]|nr:M48 family metallopeptidase [Flammeovirgaceae bacterium SG7u.132]WPO34304.1 M48 family metallopeptidase [Flammeovirgaceae bacterium SG7u.111]
MSQTLLYIIIAIVVAEFALERILDFLNQKNRSTKLPESLKGIYDDEKYAKSQKYSAAKDKLALYSSAVSLVAVIVMLLGGFAWLDSFVGTQTESSLLQTLLFFAIIGVGSDILGTPFGIYSTFVIEEKFGFNKTTPKTYIIDKIKGWVLGAIIGGLLLTVFIWFYEAFREYFWLYAWVIFMAFTIFITMFYTNLIVPLFNKLTPLEDGELRQAIEAYAKKVKFPLKNIMVIDGSKRSTKANAYFSGLGGAKNIVLYDTLIEKQETEELVSVLAHEVGHYKKKHTLQGLAISSATMLLTLYILNLVVDNPVLSQALGADAPSLHMGLIAFSILYSPLSTVTGLIMNVFSRKNEFEADEYAVKTSSGSALQSSLKKLSVDSLSNMEPHPAYVFFYYSHPPLLKRLDAMAKVKI